MWTKTNSKWTYYNINLKKSNNFFDDLVSNKIFTISDEEGYSYIYTPCWKFDDVYEYFRLYSNNGLNPNPMNDKYGFSIISEFDKNRALSYFNNIKKVRLATSDTEKVMINDVTRKPINNIDFNTLTTNIDGIDLIQNDRILVKDQYEEIITRYSYTSTGPYTLKILDNTSPFIREYFSDGNEVTFFDGNDKYSSGILRNKRIELILGSNYLVFDVYEGVPDSSLNYTVADLTDGEWVKSYNSNYHNIYKYDSFNGFMLESDFDLLEDAKDAYVWVLEGNDNKDKCFRLDRDVDGNITYSYLDKYFTEVTPTIIQHKLNYNIDPITIDYSSNKFKTLILDYDIAKKITAYDTSINNRKYETGEIFSTYNTLKIKFEKSCDGVDNILKTLDDTIYSRSNVVPSYEFVTLGLNQDQYRYVTGDILFANVNNDILELDLNNFSATEGDFVLLKGYDSDNTLLFEQTFIVQNTLTSSTGTDELEIFPPISNEIKTELTDSSITFFIENLNIYLTNGPITLSNSTFTTNLNGWSQIGTGITWTTGSNRANVIPNNANSKILYQSISFEYNKEYFTSINRNSDTDILLLADDGSNTFSTILEIIPKGSGTYNSSVGYIIPDTTTKIGFKVLANTTNTITTAWIDTVVITTLTAPNICSNINKSPLGEYYLATSTDTLNLNLTFGKSTDGIYNNEEIEVKTDDGSGYVSTLKLKYDSDRASLPTTIYSPFYDAELLLDQIDGGSTFPNSYDFNESHNETFDYNNIVGVNRFGLESNKIHIGISLTDYDYLKPGMFIEIYNDTTSTSIVESALVVKKDYIDDEVVYTINYMFTGSPASPNDVIIVRVRLLVSELSEDLKYINKYTQEAYAEILSRNTDISSNITNILYKGNNGYPLILSNLVSGDLTDLRNDLSPIAYYRVGTDLNLKTAQIISDSDWSLTDTNRIEIINTTTLNTKIRFVDGLKEIYVSGKETKDKSGNDMTWQQKYKWILNPSIVVVNAVVGVDSFGNMIWYKGDWRSGTWEDGIWMSGTWRKGTWKTGTWNAYNISDDGNQNVKVIYGDTKNSYSIWYNGTWKNGIWNLGTWNDGSWQTGTWNDGLWNNGTWLNGIWNAGVWANGTWNNGTWNGGDFELGIWNNGTWNQTTSILSRFGTKAVENDRAFWYNGTWNGGQFHSNLKVLNNTPQVSDDHRYSIWFNGTWNGGDWYGGTFIAGNWNESVNVKSIFYGGVWLGGWRITNITEKANIKTFTIDPSQYDSILDISITSHHLISGQNICFTGKPVSDTVFSNALLANKLVDNGSIYTNGTNISLIPQTYKQITVLNDTQFSISINQNIGSTTWYNVSHITTGNSPDGSPMCGAIWNGGTFKNGTFMNGIFVKGTFESGLFVNGLLVQANIGVTL